MSQVKNSMRVLVDLNNIDFMIGYIVGRKPTRSDRGDLEALAPALAERFGRSLVERDVCLYLSPNANLGKAAFYRYVRCLGFNCCVPNRLTISGERDPVDNEIRLVIRDAGAGDILVVSSHDYGFADDIRAAVARGVEVTIVGFVEWLSPALHRLIEDGISDFIDLGDLPNFIPHHVNALRPRFE